MFLPDDTVLFLWSHFSSDPLLFQFCSIFFDKLPEIFESFQKKKHVLTRVSNCDATGSAAKNLITTVPADVISQD